MKVKGIEKFIYGEHRKLHTMSELNAKFRYIQLCRSLRTYGVTFFLVKVGGDCCHGDFFLAVVSITTYRFVMYVAMMMFFVSCFVLPW